jgi:Flp pilus assembly protein TadG
MRTAPNLSIRRNAATIVEVTVMVAMLLMLLFGIIEYGRFLMARQVLESAAREGARYAVVHTYDKTTADVQNVTFDSLAGQQKQLEGFSKTSNIQVYRAGTDGNPVNSGNSWNHANNNWKDAVFAEPIAVRITGNYRPLLPSFLLIAVNSSGTIPLQITAVMYSEAN